MIRTVLLLVRDLLHFVALGCSSHKRLAAENLFRRKQLAFYVERKVKPRRTATVTFVLLITSVAAMRHSPARQSSDRLEVSPNHRFFQTGDEAPFFWLGDTAWLLFERLNRAESKRYLEDRRTKGFNVVQAMVLQGPGSAAPRHLSSLRQDAVVDLVSRRAVA